MLILLVHQPHFENQCSLESKVRQLILGVVLESRPKGRDLVQRVTLSRNHGLSIAKGGAMLINPASLTVMHAMETQLIKFSPVDNMKWYRMRSSHGRINYYINPYKGNGN